MDKYEVTGYFEIEPQIQVEYSPPTPACKRGHPDTWSPPEAGDFSIIGVIFSQKEEELAKKIGVTPEMVEKVLALYCSGWQRNETLEEKAAEAHQDYCDAMKAEYEDYAEDRRRR